MASVTTSLHASVAAGPGWLAGGWLLQNSSASTYNSTRKVSGSTAGLLSRKAGTATPPYSSETFPFNSHQALKPSGWQIGKPRGTGLAMHLRSISHLAPDDAGQDAGSTRRASASYDA